MITAIVSDIKPFGKVWMTHLPKSKEVAIEKLAKNFFKG